MQCNLSELVTFVMRPDVPAEPAPVPEWWSEDYTDNRPVMMYNKEGWATISRDYIECLVNLAELRDDSSPTTR